MRIGIYWYSATGNTLFLARACRDFWVGEGHEVTAFDMLNRENLAVPVPETFDRVVFAFPVMVFRVPEVARRFVTALPVAGKPVEAYLMLTSGGMAAKTDSLFEKLLAEKNIRLLDAVEPLCPDSYIPFRKYFAWFEKKGLSDDAATEAARRFAAAVVGKAPDAPRKPWGGPVRWFFDRLGSVAPYEGARQLLGPRFLDERLCKGCGVCAGVCPTGAIHMEGTIPKVKEADCIGCVACFNNCPENAWRLKRFDKKYHYRKTGEKVWRGMQPVRL